jgi:hypothetical protein
LDIALDLYAVGDRLGVVETDLGTVGLATCADNFGSSLALGHVLARTVAQVILSPSVRDEVHAQDEVHHPIAGCPGLFLGERCCSLTWLMTCPR